MAERQGFRAHVVPPLLVDGVPVSSSEIRAALRVGDVERAQRFLGRPYRIGGRVIRGAGRGRSLGFPTANVLPDRAVLIPGGVYAAWAEVADARHAAVVNIGVRPTFGEDQVVIEAHLLDFTGLLYDGPLHLALVARLRDEQRFPGPEALRAQIGRDIARARSVLGSVGFTLGGAGGSI
jgi:riboflavin kinase/FMN adenylyltransferase